MVDGGNVMVPLQPPWPSPQLLQQLTLFNVTDDCVPYLASPDANIGLLSNTPPFAYIKSKSVATVTTSLKNHRMLVEVTHVRVYGVCMYLFMKLWKTFSMVSLYGTMCEINLVE